MTMMTTAFEEMVARQKVERRAELAAALAARRAAIDDAVTSIPIRVRLVALLNEARRFERARVTSSNSQNSPLTKVHADSDAVLRSCHLAHIDAGYRNLLEDVRTRCDAIERVAAPPSQLYSLGTEAIGCFSTMLPWSDGIVSVEEIAAAPVAPVAPRVDVFAPRFLPSVNGRTMKHPNVRRAQHSTASPPPQPSSTVAPLKWTAPTKLNCDNRKLAAAIAGRRRVLQQLYSSNGQSAASCGSSMSCCGPAASPMTQRHRSATAVAC